jgi:tRNA pseudouridine38-40 synthase
MRLLVTLEYDGTDFEGFQVQKRGRTVQGDLERALVQITGETIRVTGGGRTDSGVHALGQSAHFDTSWHRPIETLQRALNAVLPTDIAVRTIARVADYFSARYSATSREYRYTILNQPSRSPLEQRYALLVPEQLDTHAMDAAARCLIGVHDFGSFGTAPRGDVTTREMYHASVERTGAQVIVELKANAFLYRMVRRIVGTLLIVGKGVMGVDEFREVLKRRGKAGPSVPPQGLCLVAVNYELAAEDTEGIVLSC